MGRPSLAMLIRMSAPRRKCPRCGKKKPLTFDNFYRSKQTPSGFRSWCRDCVNAANKAFDAQDEAHRKLRSACVVRSRNRTPERRAAHVDRSTAWREKNFELDHDTRAARRFGVPKGWLLEQLKRTGGRCEICGVEHRTEAYPKFISVDHCHTTGKTRGLLCSNCNFGLGHFKHATARLEAALRYLKERS